MRVLQWFQSLLQKYRENKKRDEMYARLDRNGAGRFSQKKYIKSLNKTVKSEREKRRNKQEDSKK